MNRRKLKLPDGREVEALSIPFQTGGEHWNEYLLDDGSVVRIKPVMTEILRVEGEYDPMGNPAYIVSATQVVSVSSPDDLRKKD